jgi:hypothetical protein
VLSRTQRPQGREQAQLQLALSPFYMRLHLLGFQNFYENARNALVDMGYEVASQGWPTKFENTTSCMSANSLTEF